MNLSNKYLYNLFKNSDFYIETDLDSKHCDTVFS